MLTKIKQQHLIETAFHYFKAKESQIKTFGFGDILFDKGTIYTKDESLWIISVDEDYQLDDSGYFFNVLCQKDDVERIVTIRANKELFHSIERLFRKIMIL